MCVRALWAQDKHDMLADKGVEAGRAEQDEQADRAAGDHQRVRAEDSKVTQLSPPSLTMCAWLYKVLEASCTPRCSGSRFATRLFKTPGP